MSYANATAFAASLATTLMVSIIVFQAGDGTHGAMPADELRWRRKKWSGWNLIHSVEARQRSHPDGSERKIASGPSALRYRSSPAAAPAHAPTRESESADGFSVTGWLPERELPAPVLEHPAMALAPQTTFARSATSSRIRSCPGRALPRSCRCASPASARPAMSVPTRPTASTAASSATARRWRTPPASACRFGQARRHWRETR